MSATGASNGSAGSSPALIRQFGSRIGRDTMIYGAGNTIVLAMSLISVTLFTNFMPPSEYGVLSILFFLAGALTILLNLVPLAGILRWVWVAGEADSGAVDDPSRQAPGGTKRRALGTGCWMSFAFTILGCAILVPLAQPLSKLLIGHDKQGYTDVLLAIASGAAGSIFRLTANVVRMERRPVAFSVILSVRPTVALLVAAPLVISGDAVEGALIGTIAGSLVGAIAAFITSRASYSAGFSFTDVRGITDLGLKYTFVISGLWVVHNADAFVLSRFASHATVGVYRVAARIGAILSYLVASFLQAWSPLERGALFQSTYEAHGLQRVHSKMITYFVLAALTVMLGLSLSGELLVSLVPAGYHGAAGLIPFTSFFFVVYGLFVLIARTTYHRHRDFVHQLGAAMAAVVYVGVAALLVPRWGGYGLAISATIGMAIGCLCFRVIVPTASHYAILDWPRLLGGTAVTAGCIVLGQAPDVGHGVLRGLLGLVSFFLVYPAAMILLRIVEPDDIQLLRDVVTGTLRQFFAPLRRRSHGAEIARTLRVLEPDEIATLQGLIGDRISPAKLAAERGVSRSVLEGQAARALRTLAGAESSERDDAAIGYWLFETRSSAERDIIMYNLIDHGVTVTTLHAVEAAKAALKMIPADLWPASTAELQNSKEIALSLEPSIEFAT